MVSMVTRTLAAVTVAAALLVAVAAPVAGQAAAPAVDDSIYVGTPADACPTVGRVLRECDCSMAVTPPRALVLPTDEASGLWCPVVDGPSITRYFCDSAGESRCNVVCRPAKDYCASPLRADRKCGCGRTGHRIVVVRK